MGENKKAFLLICLYVAREAYLLLAWREKNNAIQLQTINDLDKKS